MTTLGPPGPLEPDVDATVVIQRINAVTMPYHDEITAPIPRIGADGGAPRPIGETGSPATGPATRPAPSDTDGMRTERTAGVVRAGSMMAVATLVSRATGFVAKVVLLAFLGFWVVNDSYNLANTLPNIIFELLIGGVLTSVAIPLLSRARSDPDGGEGYTQQLFSLAVVALVLATGAAMAAAPALTRLYSAGSTTADPQLATELAYLLLPQIFFYGVAALFGAILNTKEHFAAPAWAPVVNNLVVIAVGALLLALPSPTAPAHGLATLSRTQFLLLGVGTTAGIVLQAAVMLPALWRSGFRFRWRWGLDSRMAEAGRLMAWAVGYALISQAGYIVTARVAFDARGGFYALYNYGSMLFQLPYGILGVSLLTAIMPRMSRHAAAGDMVAVKKDMGVANRLSAVALLPVTAAMIALAVPLAIVTAKYGKVTGDARILGFTLAAFAIGLLPLAVTLVQMRVFYAVKDGRTPTLINLAMVVVRIPLLLACRALPQEWVVPGLAAAMSASYLVGVVVGEVWLRVRFGPMGSGRTLATVGKVAVASAVGGAAAWFVVDRLLPLTGGTVAQAVVQLAVGGLVGLLVAGAGLLALRVGEVDALRRKILRWLGFGGDGRDGGAGGSGPGSGHGTLVGAAQQMPGAARPPQQGQGRGSVTDQHNDPEPDRTVPVPASDETVRVSAADLPHLADPASPASTADPDATIAVSAADVASPASTADPDATIAVAADPDVTHRVSPTGHAGSGDAPSWAHGVAAHATPTAFAPGTIVGERYRLVSLVATDGGRNRFWRARDTVLPRDMAVTLLPEMAHTAATVSRTLRAGRLHHIGLPQTLDVGNAGDAAYVVGQWVDGATLADLLTGGPLDPAVATTLTAKIADAVGEAHRNGIALGAIHPSLVRVNFDGQVRLSHVIAHAGATTDADIRAVGALLYLMLTGTWPLAAADGAPQLTPAPTRGGRELPAVDVNPAVPVALSALAERALHPDDPQGIHVIGAITALLRPPDMGARGAVGQGPRIASATSVGTGSGRAGGTSDPGRIGQAQPVRALGPAERKIVKERRIKLSIAGAMLAALAALMIIVGAALTKNFLTGIVEPIEAGNQQQPIVVSTPTTTRTVGPSTAASSAVSASGSQSGTAPGSTAPTTTAPSTSAVPGTVIPVTNGAVYDPQGTPPHDYTSLVDRAYDGDPGTFWSTWVYNQQFGPGGIKDGVGLILTFAKAITPSSVTVSTGTPGTVVQIRSAATANPALSATTVLGTATLGTDPVSITLSSAPQSQYLVVWISALVPYQGTDPKNIGKFQSNLTEISVTGS